MNARLLSQALFPFATLVLCSQLALAQETPTPPAAPANAPAASPAAAPAAPIERHPRPPMAPRPPRPAMMRDHPAMGPLIREHGIGMIGSPMAFGMERKWWKDTAVAEQLNLTPEQIKRMDSTFEQSKLQLIDLRANVEKQELLLEPLLSANPVETSKAMAQIDKVANARADLEKANAKMLLGIRSVLTPDQWTKLNERHRDRDRDRDRESFKYREGGPTSGPSPTSAPAGSGTGAGRGRGRGGQPGNTVPTPPGF